MSSQCSTNKNGRATRPSRKEIEGAVEALLALLIPVAKREWESDRARREAAEALAAEMQERGPACVAEALDHWSMLLTPPEDDCCEDQRETRATIEDAAARMVAAAQEFAEAVADFDRHDPDCDECEGARLAEAFARKGDDEC